MRDLFLVMMFFLTCKGCLFTVPTKSRERGKGGGSHASVTREHSLREVVLPDPIIFGQSLVKALLILACRAPEMIQLAAESTN